MEILQHVSKNSVSIFVTEYMKYSHLVISVLVSYILNGQWLKVKEDMGKI